jgi:hypothetical protein
MLSFKRMQVSRLIAYTAISSPQALDFCRLKLPFGYPVSLCNQDILISKQKKRRINYLVRFGYGSLILPPASVDEPCHP